MTPDLRWRVVTLQIVLVVVLAFLAGFLYWAASFTHSYVHDQLVAQKIAFPPAGSKAITSLPASDAQAMTQYEGQPLDNGDQAQTYANHSPTGTYVLWAAIGLTIAAIAVFLALLFEVLIAPQRAVPVSSTTSTGPAARRA